MEMPEGNSPNIALCLSGGGFRATLFHLGVIKALRRHSIGGVPLIRCVSEIYSVSGGSITGAHLVRNWSRYLGDDAAFAAAEGELLKFVADNVRDRVVRRWVLRGWQGKRRGYWLQSEYRRLLGSGTLGDCYREARDGSPPPRLNILATSFKTGELCAFTPDNFEIAVREESGFGCHAAPGDLVELAYCVAASSAFPPMFPPIALTRDMLGEPESDAFLGTLYLSDGGVYDNLGVEAFRMRLARKDCAAPPPDTLLVCNAGGSFRTEPGNTYASIFNRNVRASDILMRRVAESTQDVAASLSGVRHVPVRIGATVDDDGLAVATQERLRMVRTDLDRFDPALSAMLIDHGQRVASAALTGQGWSRPGAAAVSPPSAPSRQLDEIARKAARRNPWSLISDFRDWKTLPLIWLGATALVGSAGYTVYSAIEARQKAADAKDQAISDTIAALKSDFDRLDTENTALKRQLASRTPASDIIAYAPAPTPPSSSSGSPAVIDRSAYRVWLQFAGTLTRDEMIDFGNAVAAKWPNAPGASRGGERTPAAAGQMEVRCNPADLAAARQLTSDVLATGIVARMNQPRPVAKVPQGSLEIWISR